MSDVPFARVLGEIRRNFRGVVADTPAGLAPYEHDFGGMVRRRPLLVLRPHDAADLATVLRVAAEHDLPVSVRGTGHSQAGQCLGAGLVLDLRGVGGEPSIDPLLETMTVGAGATWHEALEASLPKGVLPLGLTHALDTTVGGTLSIAGIGAETFRVGPQVDNVRWIDVATLNGEIVRAGPDQNRELFDAVRGGLGQCGVMVRVGYPVRRCGSRIRTECFAYRDPAAFVSDVQAVCELDAPPRFVSGALVRSWRLPGQWTMILLVGRDFDEPHELEAGPLPELHSDATMPAVETDTWAGVGKPSHAFFRVFGNAPPATGARLCPWVEHVFSSAVAQDVLDTLCRQPAEMLGHGPLRFIFIRRGPEPAPLFRVPEPDGLHWGVGMFAEFSEDARDVARESMAAYARALRPFAGKRYLSGFDPFGEAPCSAHYGAVWDAFRKAKVRFDPTGVLSESIIDWGGHPS